MSAGKVAVEIIGRDEELDSMLAFLDRPAEGAAALVLEGEAGIGKSTLWRAGVEATRARGLPASTVANNRRESPSTAPTTD